MHEVFYLVNQDTIVINRYQKEAKVVTWGDYDTLLVTFSRRDMFGLMWFL